MKGEGISYRSADEGEARKLWLRAKGRGTSSGTMAPGIKAGRPQNIDACGAKKGRCGHRRRPPEIGAGGGFGENLGCEKNRTETGRFLERPAYARAVGAARGVTLVQGLGRGCGAVRGRRAERLWSVDGVDPSYFGGSTVSTGGSTFVDQMRQWVDRVGPDVVGWGDGGGPYPGCVSTDEVV